MNTLTPPDFIERDPVKVEAEMVSLFESLTGRKLLPAQPERVFISVMAYRETLLREQIQDVGTQNMVAFARAPMLDYLGELVGTARLPAQTATCTLEFTLSAARLTATDVPAGTRVQSADGAVAFATDAALSIPAGVLTGSVAASATVAGVVGNGYAVGEVTEILDPVPYVSSARNTTATAGGAEIEDDERYRERVRQAPERFSAAGSIGAYRFHALSVDSSVVAVEVTNPTMGVVRLYVLADTGLPSAALLAAVQAAVSAETVRPLTDTVEVVAPTEVSYQIAATIRPRNGVDTAALMAAAEAAAEAYADDRRAGLGRDVVRSQIVAALYVPGAYDVQLTTPAADVVVGTAEWANCTGVVLTQGAAADG